MLSNYTRITGSDNQGQIEISDPGQILDCLVWCARICFLGSKKYVLISLHGSVTDQCICFIHMQKGGFSVDAAYIGTAKADIMMWIIFAAGYIDRYYTICNTH